MQNNIETYKKVIDNLCKLLEDSNCGITARRNLLTYCVPSASNQRRCGHDTVKDCWMAYVENLIDKECGAV